MEGYHLFKIGCLFNSNDFKISVMHFEELLKKYDVPVPRYTSYPTMPFWNIESFTLNEWLFSVRKIFEETNSTKGISLYIHLPFCESLCTYCACNMRITKNHKVEEKYLQAVIHEWQQYLELFNEPPIIRELHIGGGTPTFFSPENLEKLINGILKFGKIHPQAEFSFEGHPNNTTQAHLQQLYKLGFKRVSFGVQDLDYKVQKTINRIQPFENLECVTHQSRALGYESISYDLVYGLPFQTSETVENTVKQIITLKPDRLSFYSYAHVPWLKPGQRGYEDSDLPSDVVKRSLYETGRSIFLEAGYIDIGMDHFALPNDTLAVAQQAGTLHRNFMGYTTTATNLLIGLGASSISDSHYGYAQNLKKVEEYQEKVFNGEWAVFKGHHQSKEDLFIKHCILEIACKGKLQAALLEQTMNETLFDDLSVMQQEGIIMLSEFGFEVTELGRAFIRNVCSLFDKRMKSLPEKKIFSKAI
jgi:oxygen-independent coproporphyrinogen-3 oxidase